MSRGRDGKHDSDRHKRKEDIVGLSGADARRALNNEALRDVKNDIKEKLSRGESPSVHWGEDELPYRPF